MITTFRLSDNWDLDITGGKCQVLTQAEALAQRVRASLLLGRGEDRYDESRGFPWLPEVFRGKYPPQALAARIKSHVEQVEGVERVDDVEVVIDPQTRLATINMLVNQTVSVSL